MPDLFASTLKVNPTGKFGTAEEVANGVVFLVEPDGQPHLRHQPRDRRRPHGRGLGGSLMQQPCQAHDPPGPHPSRLEQRVPAAPQDRARRDRASSRPAMRRPGSSRKTSTAADLEKLDLAVVNPVTGPVYIDGAKPGDALKVTVLSLQPSGWGWTGNIPGFGLLADQFPRRTLHHWNYDPGLDARDVRAGRPRAAAARSPARSAWRRRRPACTASSRRAMSAATWTCATSPQASSSTCRSRSTARCSRSATRMPRKATARSAARRSRARSTWR